MLWWGTILECCLSTGCCIRRGPQWCHGCGFMFCDIFLPVKLEAQFILILSFFSKLYFALKYYIRLILNSYCLSPFDGSWSPLQKPSSSSGWLQIIRSFKIIKLYEFYICSSLVSCTPRCCSLSLYSWYGRVKMSVARWENCPYPMRTGHIIIC